VSISTLSGLEDEEVNHRISMKDRASMRSNESWQHKERISPSSNRVKLQQRKAVWMRMTGLSTLFQSNKERGTVTINLCLYKDFIDSGLFCQPRLTARGPARVLGHIQMHL